MLAIGHPCVGIADRKAVDNSSQNIDKYLNRGVIETFSNLSDLSAFYGIPLTALERTLLSYNSYVKELDDKEFGKPIRPISKTIDPPYYAVRLWPKVHYTVGGLKIDAEARILNQNNQPLKGLYAAGEVTGGIHGATRLASCSITECLVMGRIAGRNASLLNR